MSELRGHKVAVLVVGMHRSGTSAVTRVLNLLGCALPRTVSAGAFDNVSGFWENPAIRDLNDEILESAGTAWYGWEVFDPRWYSTPVADGLRERAQALLENELEAERLFVLKDPRFCRLLPFWIDAAREFGAEPVIVCPIRNPLDVARSLEARDGIDPYVGLLMWLRSVLEAEAASRDVTRAFLRYERFLSEPHSIVDRLGDTLGIAWPRCSTDTDLAIEEFLSPSLRHHRNEDFAVLENPRLSSWLRSSFSILDRWAGGSVDEGDVPALDRIRAAFDDAAPAFGRAVTAGVQAVLDLRAAERTLAERELRIEALGDELRSAHTKLAEQEFRNEEMSASIGAMKEVIAEREEQIRQGSANLAEIRASTSWRLTRPVRYFGVRVKRWIRVARLVGLMVRRPRGFVDALKRSRGVLREGGPGGLVQRFRRLAVAVERPGHSRISLNDRGMEFTPPAPDSKPDVLILSIIDWDFRFQRSQHLAMQFAKSGRRVFYIEMMLDPEELNIVRVRDGLYRVRLPGTDIGYLQPYSGRATEDQKLAWMDALNAFCDSVDATSFKQVIIQHPFWWQLIRSISPEYQLVFDCMDDVAGFSNTDRFVLELEEDLVAKCDALVVSSEFLFEKFATVNRPKLIRNAVDIASLTSEEERDPAPYRQDLPPLTIRKPGTEVPESEVVRIGYVGAIAGWFDAELVRQVASSQPTFQFHLCGAVSDKEVERRLRGVKNVILYGEIGYLDVPRFLREMDVLAIPFRILPIIEACDPVKFYEYSAMGKPTVATRIPELNRASDLVFFASTPEEFAEQVRKARDRGGDRDFRERLMSYAGRNSWVERGAAFAEVLEDFPLVSVIVLSYGDPGLSKAAVGSLFERGATYPNMEVVVVDNGSSASDLAEIKAFISDYPNVRIIENGENLGFGKGNNVGMRQVDGEYVLLLNNDTYVAPGAIHSMVRHLARDPELGAVGPLTNNIGNEAKVFVEYGDMDHMKKVARRLTLGYRGRLLRVNALGYFAVMFRRRDLATFGLLPEEYGLGMFEDDDHCRTIQANGFYTAVAEDGFVHHHLSASFDKLGNGEKEALFKRNRVIFEEKWGPWTPHQYRMSRPAKTL